MPSSVLKSSGAVGEGTSQASHKAFDFLYPQRTDLLHGAGDRRSHHWKTEGIGSHWVV